MNNTEKIRYELSWRQFLAVIAIFGGATVYMAEIAITNRKRLLLEGVLRLGVDGATKFYWGIAIVCALFVLCGLVIAISRLSGPGFIELGPDYVVLPYGLLGLRRGQINYSEIERISEVEIRKHQFLYVYGRGKRFGINSTWLSVEEFHKIRTVLFSRQSKK